MELIAQLNCSQPSPINPPILASLNQQGSFICVLLLSSPKMFPHHPKCYTDPMLKPVMCPQKNASSGTVVKVDCDGARGCIFAADPVQLFCVFLSWLAASIGFASHKINLPFTMFGFRTGLTCLVACSCLQLMANLWSSLKPCVNLDSNPRTFQVETRSFWQLLASRPTSWTHGWPI